MTQNVMRYEMITELLAIYWIAEECEMNIPDEYTVYYRIYYR